MADFPPNLDDGELWLPSDFFPDEIYPPNHAPPSKFLHSSKFSGGAKFNPEFPCELTYMEDLANQLALAILDEKPSPKPPPKMPPVLEIQNQRPSSRPLVNPRFGENTFEKSGFGALSKSGFGNPGFDCSRACTGLKPLPFQKPGRTRMQVQRQMNQPLPFQAIGSEVGSLRGSNGTGVFLPRIFHADTGTTQKQNFKVAEKKQEQNRNVGGVRKRVTFQSVQRSPELGLPQDWTY
ncbi:uncharacterized protein LOC18444435 isoform X1 [Amborella trichopoda]|uniref:Uncharacterized protein n=1 Tax=Amborella trichopoda TaxID=13333 RepID=U5D3Z9_AMBTC|nr:uncharacterized protein LOC18444435 isoform X1 [Amborella trichopoda]ERN16137.1 hypothetical protein AMTR_s00030p00207690 [Amborella trichopoda]|eukprot:XP_020529330.1 uncharacterized protein LOC18444435 isoform X1 [Amborella trichopoda]